jgi:hypothetical protein
MKFSTPIKILLVLLLVIFGWNYWLHSAWDMYNLISKTPSGDLHNVDFFAYYNAGGRYLRHDNPYFWGKDTQGQPIISDFIYPPTVLPVFSLLSRMPYDLARLVWLITYGLTYAGILYWISRSFLPEWRNVFLVLGIGFSMASFPLLSHIEHGQVDVFVISLILASYLCYARGKRLMAAILLAVATLIKVSPGFLLIYFVLFRRDFRFLFMFAGSLAVMALISLIFVPFGWWLDYFRFVLPEVGKGDAFWLNQSLMKYLSSYPEISRVVTVIGLGILALLVWIISRRFAAEDRQALLPLGNRAIASELVFILNLAGMLIFLGKAWVAAYVWLILPSAWLVIIMLGRRISLPLMVGISIGITLVLAKVYGFPLLDSLNAWGGVLLTTCLTIGLLKRSLLTPGSPKFVKPSKNI